MNSFIILLVLASGSAAAQQYATPRTILNSYSAITMRQEAQKSESYVGWIGLLGLLGLVCLRKKKTNRDTVGELDSTAIKAVGETASH